MYIKITDVNKTIKKAPILRDINLEFTGGKVYGLRGKNGSGKTMLMRAICGLITPDSGIIDIDGKILGKDISFPEEMGLLIENPVFLDSYTGADNLRLLASLNGTASNEDIMEALGKVGLDYSDKRKYRKYSLGMKQRLGIAATIMEHPGIIVWDEPLNALDTEGVRLFNEIIKEEKEKGTLIIMSCHDEIRLNEYSDVIVVMENGRILSVEGE